MMQPPRGPGALAKGLAASGALVAAATGLGLLAQGSLAAPDLVMLYLLAIVAVAATFGRTPSLVAAALSVLAFDFFFVPPVHTLAVTEPRHLLTFGTMFVVGQLIAGLTVRIRAQEREALERERRTASLYRLSRDLAAAIDDREVAEATVRHAVETFGGRAEILGLGSDGTPISLGVAGGKPGSGSGSGSETGSADGALRVPLTSAGETLGALLLTAGSATGGEREEPGADVLVQAFAAQAALALQRSRLAETARAAMLRARTEEVRSALLSTVSHDLRTPLGSITGAATTLRDAGAGLDVTQRAELADMICSEAARLERFVVNLLEMTRVDAGALTVKREWVPLEELIGAAMTRLEEELEPRAVHVELPPGLPLIAVDPVLLEQVFFNLLDNAAKHTPEGTPLELSAWVEGDILRVALSDRGPGLPPGDELRVFEKFYRSPSTAARGAGLGLAICAGILQAHGGTVRAFNRPGGGATFELSLPLRGEPPTVPPELEGQPREPGSGP